MATGKDLREQGEDGSRSTTGASSELEPPPITRSGQWTELHVDRRRRINECAEFELAVRELDAEHRNTVGVLVGCIEESSRGIDVHPARPLPACRFPANHLKLARVRIDFEHRDAVVTPVGVVEALCCMDRQPPAAEVG